MNTDYLDRFIMQTKPDECGPIALYNAHVWLGLATEDYASGYYHSRCDFTPGGATVRGMAAALVLIPGLQVTRIAAPSQLNIQSALREDAAVLVGYSFKESGYGHFTLVVPEFGGYVINDHITDTVGGGVNHRQWSNNDAIWAEREHRKMSAFAFRYAQV